MSLERFVATDFRCLEAVELELSSTANLFVGPNASGKTSLLEAIAYLGRGKSFRGAGPTALVMHGKSHFVLFGKTADGESLGVRNGGDGLQIRINGTDANSSASLAEALPLLVIDPAIHDLVAGGPEGRRRFLDWIGFHVEHGYLELWRRFRRSLRQRNAALRAGASDSEMSGWNKEFVETGAKLCQARAAALARTLPELLATGEALLQSPVNFEYRRGWPDEKRLAELLDQGIDRDRRQGNTYYGPQRDDVRLVYDERQARRLVSRGQQKLLACAMILAAGATVAPVLDRDLTVLLDDPAAELDQDSLGRLMNRVGSLNGQLIVTSLNDDRGILDASASVFHVEHGKIQVA